MRMFLKNVCIPLFRESQFVRIWVESNMVDEPLTQYAFTCMQARAGWVPFIHQLEIDKSDIVNRLSISKISHFEDYDNINSVFAEYMFGYDVIFMCLHFHSR